MSAGHEHSFAQTNSTRLKWALLLTGSFLVAEVVGGILTGSLALISDAAHMLTDAVALAIALAHADSANDLRLMIKLGSESDADHLSNLTQGL
ncbi:MAG: cation transporter, partial [Pseudomonas aeruginosa]|nr:cation transporter [Pseudomonas aeruginosa]